MASRPYLAISAAVIGAGLLASVATGADASFTNAISSHNVVTSGTFALKASNASASASDPQNGVTLTQPTATIANQAGAPDTLVNFSASNVDPAGTYTYQFNVYDSGSLPGVIDSITYTPGTNNALQDNATIELMDLNNGHILTNANGGPSTFAASDKVTFNTLYGTGNGLTDFVQPNPSDTGTIGGEAMTSYKMIITFNNATIPNSAEGETATSSLTVNGHNV